MAKFDCTYCQNPIATCRIQCARCEEFNLCLQCFACGAENGTHKKEHDYHVFDDGFLSVYSSTDEWTAQDELNLLDAVEQYGFGNWEGAASHVKTKTSEDCRDHYYSYFIHGSVGKVTFPQESKYDKVKDHTCPDNGPLSPSLTVPQPPVELTPQEVSELGYMPLRDDFEREFDNESESLVSGLAINYDDDDLDIAFKLAQVDIYRQRLKERQRRKKLAREYGIIQAASTLGMKKAQLNKKKLTKEEREFQDKMRVFTQFNSAKEHEKFFENLQKEKQIKVRIKELMKYRRNGITKLDNAAEFDGEKHRRDKRKELGKKKLISSTTKRSSMGSKNAERDEGDAELIIGDVNGVRDRSSSSSNSSSSSLLSNHEKQLIHSIGMKPASYITIKTCIIKDYLQRRQGLPVKIKYPSHLDKTHRRRILSFLADNGWISAAGAF